MHGEKEPQVAAPELTELFASLRNVHESGRTQPLAWRLRQLDGLHRLLTENESAITQALAVDLRRSTVDAWLGDIVSTLGEIDFARKHLKRWIRPNRLRMPLNQFPARGWVQYEPLGVVLIIGPWNYPIYLSLGPLVAAIAAGNCAVVKPSELAPASSALLAKLLPMYLDPEAVTVVEGDASTSQALLALGFDHALFTGGTEVGRKIMAAAAETLTPVTLELGGKSPVIIAHDADIAVAARRIAWLKLLNSGQTCIAPDYVLVEESVREEFVSTLLDTLRSFRIEEPEAQTPIVNDRQFSRLTGYLGATHGSIVLGGEFSVRDNTISPTVILDPDPDEPSMTEEIFGPILPIISVPDISTAVRFVRARPKPLALYAFTSSQSVRSILLKIPAGGIVFNHIAMHVLVPQLPFGGVGSSGMGAYHGEWGFQTMSHRKPILAQRTKPDLRFVYPPYTSKAIRLMRKVL